MNDEEQTTINTYFFEQIVRLEEIIVTQDAKIIEQQETLEAFADLLHDVIKKVNENN